MDIDEQRVVTLRNAGVTWSDIAEDLGVSVKHLRAWKNEHRDAVDINICSINYEEVTRLRRLRYKWTNVAAEMGVHIRTLEDWRKRSRYQDPFETNSTISDEVVDSSLREYIFNHPMRGENSLASCFAADGNICIY